MKRWRATASGCAAVFVNQTTEHVDPLDVLTYTDPIAVHRWCGCWGVQTEAPVWSGAVVVAW